MMMKGSVVNIRSMRRRVGMGNLGEGSSASAEASATGGASNVKTPVTTQVTTAVSPVFNISAGNSGDGGVTQTGSTSQTATPTSSNMFYEPSGMPMSPTGTTGLDPYGNPTMQPGLDPYGNPVGGLTNAGYPTDSSYAYDTSNPAGAYPMPASGGGMNMRALLVIAGLALGAWLIFSPSGKAQAMKIYRTVYKTKSGKRAKRKAK